MILRRMITEVLLDGLICSKCHLEYPLNTPIWRCAGGGLLDIRFAARLDRQALAGRPATLWRYREALPLPASAEEVSLGEPMTPLVPLEMDGKQVLFKQEQLFPTGSYKDRGAAVLISQVKALGIKRIVEDSSGNAGCAIAAYAARAGIACAIYVPEATSPAKLAQIKAYGAELQLVPGSREDTARAVLEAAENTYYASHSWNPFFFQGTKTFAYEVCEQLEWKAPEVLVLPVGNGTLLLGAWMGFKEMRDMGFVERLPRLIGVQAEACAPLAEAFAAKGSSKKGYNKSETLAEGIAIAQPVRGGQILAAVRESGGCFITVSEEEIGKALAWVGGQGFYIEPTAAATVAGVRKALLNKKLREGMVVSTFTGHGLKTAGK